MSAADALPLPASPTIAEAYAFCRKIAHQYGANFSVGFRFLPKQKRRAVYAAYAFCRWADDIADEPHGDVAACLNDWQRELDRCYAGHPSHPITIALADALRFFQIPKSAFVALISGCRQDLTKTRYQSFDELLHYCEMVAWSISDISLAIFGYRDGAAIEHGRKLATALQLTNVTRDIGDDLRRDRIYLPQDELRRFCATQLTVSDDTRRLIEYQIDRAESYFREAEPLLDELSSDARFPVLLMGGIYATVLGRLRLDPLAVLKERLSLSPLEKVRVVIARLLRPRFV